MSCKCEEKLPVIALWSGGFDSTFMLCNLLKEGRKVEAVSIMAAITGEHKLQMELKARCNMMPHLNKLANMYGGSISFSKVSIDWPQMAFSNTTSDKCVCDKDNVDIETSLGTMQRDVQPVIWAGNLANVLVYAPQECEVAIGYDNDTRHSTAKRYFSDIVEYMGKALNKQISVIYPLQYMTKSSMLLEMFKNYRFILDSGYSCEGTVNTPHCNYCDPCRRLRDAIIDILMGYCDDFARAYFTQLLMDWFHNSVERVYETPEESNYNKNEESIPDEKEVCESEICNNCDEAAAHTCLLCGCDFRSPYASDCLCEKCKSMLSSRN